jgi:hypothetical protein
MGQTKRVPIGRVIKRRLSAENLDLFAQLRKLECTCDPEQKYWEERCPGCVQHWDLYRVFWRTLVPRPKPWEHPCILDIRGNGDDDAEALTRALEDALEARGGILRGTQR